MALHSLLNQFYRDDYWCGYELKLIKDVLVAAGWTVVASGDGDARFATPLTADLAMGEQGVGGGKDCWRNATQRTGASPPALPGDASNLSAWIVLGNNGREVLFVLPTSSGAFYSRYYTMIVTTAGHSFIYTACSATTPPAAPAVAAAEEAFIGSRAGFASPSASTLFNSGSGIWHLVADDEAEGGDIGFWIACSPNGNTSNALFVKAMIPLLNETRDPAETDGVFWLCGSSDNTSGRVWDYVNSVWRTNEYMTNENSTFFHGGGGYLSVDDPVNRRSAARVIPAIITATTPDIWKGYMDSRIVIGSSTLQGRGKRVVDAATSRHYVGISGFSTASQFMWRWPSDGPAML